MEFVSLYPNEISAVERLLANLQKINKTWPNAFNAVISTLDASPLNTYPLPLLTQITSVFTEQFDSNKPFPQTTFDHFFAFKGLDETKKAPINAIIEKLFDKSDDSEKKPPRTDHETQLLYQLALRYCRTMPDDAINFLNKLLPMQTTKPE